MFQMDESMTRDVSHPTLDTGLLIFNALHVSGSYPWESEVLSGFKSTNQWESLLTPAAAKNHPRLKLLLKVPRKMYRLWILYEIRGHVTANVNTVTRKVNKVR